MRFLISVFFVLLYHVSFAEAPEITVDVFMSSACPHCQKADQFFQSLENQVNWVTVKRHRINQDKAALKLFYKRLKAQNVYDFSVPAIFFCNSRWVGFSDAKLSGDHLMEALRYCRSQLLKAGALTPEAIGVLQAWSLSDQFKLNEVVHQSPWRFIPMAALVDALTPCSFFCLAVFLAFLWLHPSVAFRAGMIFILTIGVVHWIRFFEVSYYYRLTGWFRWPAVLTGLGLLGYGGYLYRCRGFFQSDYKPRWVYYILMVLTAILVQIYQETCAFNVTFMADQWFSSQTFSAFSVLFYQLIYHLIYILPLTVFLLIYKVIQSCWSIKRLDLYLQTTAYLMLMMTGVILIVCPEILSGILWSWLIIIIAFVLGGLQSLISKS